MHKNISKVLKYSNHFCVRFEGEIADPVSPVQMRWDEMRWGEMIDLKAPKVSRQGKAIDSVCLSVCKSVCLHASFWTDWPLKFSFYVYMDLDLGFKVQVKVKVKAQGWLLTDGCKSAFRGVATGCPPHFCQRSFLRLKQIQWVFIREQEVGVSQLPGV